MITGELKSKVDKIWDSMWSGGISNPLSVIEQLTYLLFIKRLDELHTSMPSGVFKPYAGVSTAILLFTKTNSGGTDSVWFYDMQADGFSLDDKRTPLGKGGNGKANGESEEEHKFNNIPDILRKWRAWRSDELSPSDFSLRTSQCFLVPKDEIAGNDYDLSINRYKEVEYEAVEHEAPQVILARLAKLDEEIAEGRRELEELLEDGEKRMTGSAGQRRVPPNFLSTFAIPLPPFPFQQRIAAILDAADALRAKRRESLAQLDALLQSTFLEMFGDPVGNPMGWEFINGASAFRELTYGTSTKSLDVPTDEALPVLRIPNIIGGRISWNDLKFAKLKESERKKLTLSKDDLLFVRSNGNPDYIGRCARFYDTKESLFASYLIRGRLSESSGLDAEFLKHQIEHSTYRHKVRKEARTTAGNYNLSTAGIRKFKFIKPLASSNKNSPPSSPPSRIKKNATTPTWRNWTRCLPCCKAGRLTGSCDGEENAKSGRFFIS